MQEQNFDINSVIDTIEYLVFKDKGTGKIIKLESNEQIKKYFNNKILKSKSTDVSIKNGYEVFSLFSRLLKYMKDNNYKIVIMENNEIEILDKDNSHIFSINNQLILKENNTPHTLTQDRNVDLKLILSNLKNQEEKMSVN